MKINLLFLLFLIINVAQANEHQEAHSVSVFDLKWPFVNFAILFIFIFIKIKGPLKKSMDEKRKNVESLFNHAMEKSKDAKIKLELYQEKLSSLESQAKKMQEESKTEALKFEHDTKEETRNLLERAMKEGKEKANSAKNKIIKEVSDELLNDVIAKAKTRFNSDKSLKEKAANNLLTKAH